MHHSLQLKCDAKASKLAVVVFRSAISSSSRIYLILIDLLHRILRRTIIHVKIQCAMLQSDDSCFFRRM